MSSTTEWRKLAKADLWDGEGNACVFMCSECQDALLAACDLIEGLLNYVEHDAGCMNRYKEDGNCDCGLRKLTGEP